MQGFFLAEVVRSVCGLGFDSKINRHSECELRRLSQEMTRIGRVSITRDSFRITRRALMEMHMKTQIAMVLMAAVIGLSNQATAQDLVLTASQGWKDPKQCTFFADGLANKNGWKLTFTSAGNANTWPKNVSNATASFTPSANSIMILAGPLKEGHASWVNSSKDLGSGKYEVVVLHSNWERTATFAGYYTKSGSPTRYRYDNATFKVNTVAKTALVVGGTQAQTVLGFLKKK